MHGSEAIRDLELAVDVFEVFVNGSRGGREPMADRYGP
jgi:hypothetical protein